MSLSAQCSSCQQRMELEDAHDQCPSCLGIDHLKEALEDPCMHCSVMPLEVRRVRLAAFKKIKEGAVKRKASASAPCQKKKEAKKDLARRVDELADGMGKIQEFLAKLQPQPASEIFESGREESETPSLPQPDYTVSLDEFDCVSVAATDSLFSEDRFPLDKEPGMIDSEDEGDDHSESSLSSDDLVKVIKTALAQLGMDPTSATETAHTNRLGHSLPRSNVFNIPQSPDFTEVFSQAFKSAHSTRLDRVSRLLAAMQEPGPIGLGAMPTVEPAVASLIVPPDEALRQDPRCPNMECRRTDNLIGKIYNSTACLGRTVNTLAHVLLAIIASLNSPEATAAELVNVALRSVGSIAGHCGKAMGLLVQARRQVWIAQSPFSEPCRAALRQLPLVPGQIFGPAAQEAFDRRLVASEARNQLGKQRTSFKAPGYPLYSFRRGRSAFSSRHQFPGREPQPSGPYRGQQTRPYGPPARTFNRLRYMGASDNHPPRATKSSRRQR